MDFKAAREQRELTLKQVSTLAGYSIPTINALELEGRGSDRLKEKLQQIYQLKDSGDGSSLELHDSRPESDLELWRRRAKAAEAELVELKNGLRALLNSSRASSAGTGERRVPVPRALEELTERLKPR